MDYNKCERPLIKSVRRYEDFLQVANKHGYKHLSEFILTSYFHEQKSAIRIAEDLKSSYYQWIYDYFDKIKVVARPNGVFAQKIQPGDTFEDIDRKLNFRKKKSMSKIAQEYGYNWISEALVDLYYNKGLSLGEVSMTFGSSSTWLLKTLNKINLSPKPHGGSRYKKLTKMEEQQIQQDFETIEPSWANLREYIFKRKLEISPKTIQRLLKKTKLCPKKLKSQDSLSQK